MNERIKQLAEQARVKSHWSIDEARYLVNYLNEEKFAELIVKETMQIVANQLPSNQYLDVADAVIEHYKDNDVI
jgi:hypothetical protein